jgi:MYXO-CTERM domain-containing protein
MSFAPRIFALSIGFVLLGITARAHALGSCGTGGPTGRHINVPFAPSEYWVWAPADQTKAYPLVVAFHGDEATPEQSQRFFWDPVWQKDPNFIVVTPRAPYAMGSWYQEQAMHETWVDTVMQDVFAKYNVDLDRVYATGDSGGSVFLATYGLKRQNWFAGIQWSCGGGGRGYTAPPRDDCKLAARFVISPSDFLYDGAQSLNMTLLSHGHVTDFAEQTCMGHCCGPNSEYGAGAWAWMQTRTHCQSSSGPGCGMPGTLPPAGDAGPGGTGGAGGSGGGAGRDAGVAGRGGAGGATGGGGGATTGATSTTSTATTSTATTGGGQAGSVGSSASSTSGGQAGSVGATTGSATGAGGVTGAGTGSGSGGAPSDGGTSRARDAELASGCSCRVATSTDPRGALWLALALAAVARVRRRMRPS